MIKGILRIRDLGVFGNYARPAGTEPFAEKNIIYGWNYSGKTTLSRLFYILEAKKPHPDYPSATFSIDDNAGATLTEAGLDADTKIVRVFNSDFVERNLSWDGAAFTPILLLGEESIETEKMIEVANARLQRCREGFRKKREAVATIDAEISERKTRAAKQIKTTLSLVEAFTATHLNSILGASDAVGLNDFVLPEEKVNALLKRALSSDKDKLDFLQKLNLTPAIGNLDAKCKELLSKIPEFSSTIDYFREHPEVANWVEEGLRIHVDPKPCEFCGNNIDPTRMQALRAHFSKDLARYRQNLQKVLTEVGEARISFTNQDKGAFYTELREPASKATETLRTAVQEFNSELDRLAITLEKKLKAPFESVVVPPVSHEVETSVRAAAEAFNIVVSKNNEITTNFGKEKARAVTSLKSHYVAEFAITENLDLLQKKKTRLQRHQTRYQTAGTNLKASISQLEAKISLAQKGREEMNGHIANLLGGNAIHIEVVDEGQGDRFRLVRDGAVARNLSEGEKTAIAFSFFLSKLREIKELKDAIVYIDDPISSFDSNHIFQINSIIRELFFYQDDATKEWKTRCKQLFISTHNFEFFSLLRELPGNQKKTRFYQVKRITPGVSVIENLPDSITKYSSEYHYLYSVIHKFHHSADKGNLELLLSVPNAVRRFVELYTFARIPTPFETKVDERARILFGPQKAKRILKVLHHFSHLNNIERISKNTDLICDIEYAVADLMSFLEGDTLHFEALEAAVI